jgi:fatty-acyl-CoA synthase
MIELRTLPGALAAAARTDQGFRFLSGDRVSSDERAATAERLGSGSRVTARPYRAIFTSALGIASTLIASGLRPGDLVVIVIDAAEEFLTTFFGVSLAGTVPAPLSPPPSPHDAERCIEVAATVVRASGARAVATTAALADAFERLRPTCPSLSYVFTSENPQAPSSIALPPISLDDIALVQFTSGSTSSPKGVVISHRSLCENIDAINGPAGLASSGTDSAVSWLPLYHDMGLIGMALGPVYCGRPAVLMPPAMFVKRPVEWLRAISRYRGTISFAPSFAYDLCVRRVKDADIEGLDLSCWRVAGCGAEPIHGPTLAAFAEKFGQVGFRATSFLPSYGLAEHVLAASFGVRGRLPRVERISADHLARRRIAVPAPPDGHVDSSSDAGDGPAVEIVSCGRSLPGHQLAIIDQDGRALPPRHVGEIALAGPSVMRGYYRDEARTGEVIKAGWLRTGDLGYVDDDELFVCGRIKDIIIIYGRKYHPQDLEWAVDSLPGVRRGRVVALGAPGLERGVDRVVIVLEPAGAVSPDVLADAVRRRVFAVCGVYVDEVLIVPGGTISRTTSGKVRRVATRACYERGELTVASARK